MKDAWCAADKRSFLVYLPAYVSERSGLNYSFWSKNVAKEVSHVGFSFFKPSSQDGSFSWEIYQYEATQRRFPGASSSAQNDLKGSLRELFLLKRSIRTLKVGVVLGGPGADFSNALSTPAKINKAVSSVKNAILDYGFDFVSIDWEYPQNSIEVANLVSFVSKMRLEFDAIRNARAVQFGFNTSVTSYGKIELFMATSAKAFRNDVIGSTNYQALARSVDVFHLMGYDYDASPILYHHSNLDLPSSGDLTKQSSSRKGLTDFTNKYGVPASQLSLSFPAYAWIQPGASGLGTRAPVNAAPKTAILYRSLVECSTPNSSPCLNESLYDTAAASHYVSRTSGNTLFATFDSPFAVGKKADLIDQMGMNGLSMWHIGGDVEYGSASSLVSAYVSKLGPNSHRLVRTMNWIYYASSAFPNIATLAQSDLQTVSSDAASLK